MDINHDTGLISSILSVDTTVSPPLGGEVGVLDVVGTGGIRLPAGTSAQRPVNSAGLVRYNTDSGTLEYNNGTTWGGAGGTVTSVAATGSTGLTVGGSPITAAGTLTFTLGAELQGISGLSATGIIARTAVGTYSSRTITGTAGNIVISDGDGIAGNPTIDLASVGIAVSDSLKKITTDAYGRVTATSNVIAADINASLGYTPANKAGDSITGAFNFSGGGSITGLPAPTNPSDAATKQYVDASIQGLDPKLSVRAATISNGTFSTAFAAGSVVDGVTLVAGDRILIKAQTTQSTNGIYVVQASGAPVRALDADSFDEFPSAFTFVEEGTVNGDTGWVCVNDAGGTLGTTAITYTQFSGAGSYTAGTGITLTGSVFSLTSPVAINLGGTGLTTLGTAHQFVSVDTGGTSLEYKTVSAGTGISVTPGTGTLVIANTGVTSVGLVVPIALGTVTGSPVTSTGDLTFNLSNQSQNIVFAGPTTGSATPTFRALTYADLPIKLYKENPSSPGTLTVTGTNSVVIGSGSTATANNSIATGLNAEARLLGSSVHASGNFAIIGDAQTGLYVLRNTTTNASNQDLFLDGVSARLLVPNNSVWVFDVLVTARRIDATGGGAGYKFTGVVRKDTTSGSLTFIGTPSKQVLGKTNGPWNASVIADTTNGGITIQVSGEGGKTIRWVATVITSEVTS
jgi:hypothetical protein